MFGALNKLGVESRRALSNYAVGSSEPELAFDFESNTYVANGTKNLSQAMTHSRSGNATMTDGYGPELVTNGTFDTDISGWGVVAVAAGSVSYDGARNAIEFTGDGSSYLVSDTDIGLIAGKVYEVTFELLDPAVVTTFGFGDNVSATYSASASTGGSGNRPPGVYSAFITATGDDNFKITHGGGNPQTFSIDNVSVREMPVLKWAPHNLLTYSEDLTGADWTETGTASVDDFETISFAADDGSRLQSTGVSASAGPEYTVEFDYISDGTFEVLARAASVTQASNTASASVTQTTHTLTVPAGSSGVDSLWFRRNAGFTATEVTIRNVRIYRSDLGGMVDNPERGDSYVPTAARPFGPELFSDFELEGEWIDNNDGSYTVTSATTSTDLRNNSFVVTGKTYEYKFTISGDTQIVYLGSTSPEFLSAGTYTKVVTANTHWLIFRATTGQTATVSNISIKETVNPAVARYLPRVGHHVYNGDAWVNEGLLHESEARTNLITYSEDFSNAAWVKTLSTISSDLTTSPDGTVNADKVVEDTSNNIHRIQFSITPAASTAYTTTVFAKAAERTFLNIQHDFGGANTQQYFNLSTGAIASTFGASYTNRSIVDCGNGWYRCSLTTTTSTTTAGAVRLHIASADGTSSYTGDGTSGIYVYGAQLEEASTPSSYIPTAGATVTRAAETLTVPAANLPWPYPEVIGPELVTNGTFDTDTSGWTANADAVVTWSSGEIVVQRVTGSIDTAIQEITTEVGKVYYISADTTDLTATGSLKIATAAGGGLNASTFESATGVNTTLSVIFIAQTTTTYIALGGNAGGTISSYDNISVREINPLSVSIQMDGRMTYADEDGTVANTFALWEQDSSNSITLYRRDSVPGNTGEAIFFQKKGAEIDFVASGSSTYSPGILVPYNIASRHGSTFVNGAVDGVALTANTTPVELPDLSATDLELGYDYMGTINTFRVWSQDLGDTGIVTASAPSLEPSLSLTFDGSGLSFTVLDWSE